MSPGLYLVLTLLPLVATVALLIKWGSLTLKREILLRILTLLGTLFIYVLMPVYSDQPNLPAISSLGFPCIPLAIFFVKPLRVACVMGVLIAVLAFSNASMYERALRPPDVTQRYLWPYESKNRRALLDIAYTVSEDTKAMSAAQPARFIDSLTEPGLQADLNELNKINPVREYRLRSQWHSRLTGLYELESRPARVWFKGGRLDQDQNAYEIVGVGQFKPGLWPPPYQSPTT